MPKSLCRICDNENLNQAYQLKEMMFGIRDEFTYFECSVCGCLQISEFPEDISKYYPQDYYSFSESSSTPPLVFAKSLMSRFLKEEKHKDGTHKILQINF